MYADQQLAASKSPNPDMLKKSTLDYPQDCTSPGPSQTKNIGGALGPREAIDKALYESHYSRLSRISHISGVENRRRQEVMDILARHPEFEEFLIVLRSGLV